LVGTEGFHVLKVWPNSPGHKAGLEPFFDFIIGVNTLRLDINGDHLKKACEENADKEVKLTVYNSKNQDVRELVMVPNNTWGGKGLLGLSIRFTSFEGPFSSCSSNDGGGERGVRTEINL
jgi:hypothetical protein